MNCPHCGSRKYSGDDYYGRCRECGIENYQPTRKANLYPHIHEPRINQIIRQISELWKQEYLIFIALVLAYTICMIWIGMLLTPRVIG